VGLPAKGSLVKLAPVEEKLAIRVRSPSVTPGYWRQPALPLRAELIAALSPFAQDVVIAGHDADYLAVLIVPEVAVCRGAPDLPKELQARLCAHAQRNAASTRRIRRALLLPSPPSLHHGEITDTGSINQRAELRHREDLVAALYAPDRVADVMEIDAP
jgi:feruloyl-CoA synthase